MSRRDALEAAILAGVRRCTPKDAYGAPVRLIKEHDEDHVTRMVTDALAPLLAEWSAQDRAEAWDEGWRAAATVVSIEGEKTWAHTAMPEGYEGNPYSALTPGGNQ